MLARFAIGQATPGAGLWATAAINIAGCIALGLLVGGAWLDGDLHAGVTTGFLGGFTTFSAFAVDVVTEVDNGAAGVAAVYLAVSVVGGIAGAAAGLLIGCALT